MMYFHGLYSSCIRILYLFYIFFFFFSSRRRHTRYIGDWSSDVCSSDLKRQLLLAQKFGFLLLYNGPLIAELKSPAQAAKRGAADAASAAAAAIKEGFPSRAIIFLDIEEGRRLSQKSHAYFRQCAAQLGCS